MQNSQFLPDLTFNSLFIEQFTTEKPSCFSLGVLEHDSVEKGFIAIKPRESIPQHVTSRGFNFGQEIFSYRNDEIIHFIMRFYDYRDFHILLNPNHEIVRRVLRIMKDTGDYFFCVFHHDSGMTSFRNDLAGAGLSLFENNLNIINGSKTSSENYENVVTMMEPDYQRNGEYLKWVCRDNIEFLNLRDYRLEANPTVPEEEINNYNSFDLKLITEAVELMLKGSKEQLKKFRRAEDETYYLPEDKIEHIRISLVRQTDSLDEYRSLLKAIEPTGKQAGKINTLRRKIRQMESLIDETGTLLNIIEKKSSDRKETDHREFIRPERRKELEKGYRENPFRLPPGVTKEKEIMTDGNQAWVFRHRDLGRLGRILIQPMEDGQSLTVAEVSGEEDDPLTAKRKEIFEPIVRELTGIMEKVLGKGKGSAPANIKTPDGGTMAVASRILQCEECGDPAAMMIFAEHAKTPDEMEDYARMTFRMVTDRKLPAWILGCALTDPLKDPDAPSYAMKVWPEKETIQLVTPDQILPDIDEVVENHCKTNPSPKDPNQEQLKLVKIIDDFVRKIEGDGGGDEELLRNMHHQMYNFHKLMELCHEDELNFLTETHPGFGRYAHMINSLAGALSSGFIKENPDGSFS